MLWMNKILWDLRLRWVSDRYPILHSPPGFLFLGSHVEPRLVYRTDVGEIFWARLSLPCRIWSTQLPPDVYTKQGLITPRKLQIWQYRPKLRNHCCWFKGNMSCARPWFLRTSRLIVSLYFAFIGLRHCDINKCHWTKLSFGLSKSLSPIRQEAITWTNAP